MKQVLIGLDQLGNTLLGGMADETLSSRAYRRSFESEPWLYVRKFIDAVFFFDENHCEESYKSEVNRKQFPRALR